ncbi:MAG: aminotransferase class V-fold PLP-dependent enzyme, partial [Pseudomonadales bacterium]
HKVLSYAFERASGIEGLKRVGMAQHQVGIFSFLIDGVHPSDLGMLLDKQGIAVRTGHHCTQPLMEFFNIPGTVRASFAFYNTTDEVDRLFEGLEKARELLR